MASNFSNIGAAPERNGLIAPIVVLWGAAILAVGGYLLFDAAVENTGTKLYLLPWTFLTGLVIALPSVVLMMRKKFNLFHPLVFAAWSYFFPAFFVGGLILSAGLSQPYFLAFVQNEQYDLPLTLIYVMLGYGGLSLGFALPFGRRIGEMIAPRLPKLLWTADDVIRPGLVLLGLGLFNTAFAFSVGLLGFQRVDEIGAFDGVIFLLTFFWLQATFLLWLGIFRAPSFSTLHYVVMAALLLTSLLKAAFQGNRGSLIQIFILVTFAFVASGRKIQIKHKIRGGALLILALLFGMIYGTTFRTIKTTTERVSMDEYMTSVVATFEKISEEDIGESLGTGFLALAERLENVSQLAVVVSNHESLAAYEAGYGLDNNIWKDSVAFLVPRILWPDKPVATDPYKYGELYFNFGENSFTLTPMGDLLRNFGGIGVPLGMIFLGFVIRVVYASLVENQEFSFWRVTLFYMLLTGISYEGSFGLIIPYDIKIGLVSVLGLAIVWFLVGKLGGGRPRPAGAQF